jgi:DNA repair exonuclease SbcCD nuclease subunit
MKVALIADPHLGFGQGERKGDAAEALREAFQKAMEKEADLILILGDVLHAWTTRRLEDLAEFIGALSLAREKGAKVIAIAGNHEAKGGLNILQVVARTGLLAYLDCETLTFEKEGEKVAVHGMGHRDTPAKARSMLRAWFPKPVEGAFNILVLHQGVGDFVYAGARDLDFSDLPGGFDLYATGHIHLRAEASVDGAPLLIPGSLIQTQLSREEQGVPKGFYMFDTSTRSWEFVEVSSRDFYYVQIEARGERAEELRKRAEEEVEKALSQPRRNPEKKPLVRVRIIGSLAPGEAPPNPREIEDAFREQAIVSVGMELGVVPVEAEKIRELRERPVSAMDLVAESFRKHMGEGPMDAGELLKMLVEKEPEETEEAILRAVEEKVRSSG